MTMRKTIFTLGLMLAAALSLTSCSKNEEVNFTPELKPSFELFANLDSRTVNEGMSTKWASGDAINVFHAEATSDDYKSDGSFSTADASGLFKGTLAETLDQTKSYDWYAFYPYESRITTPANTSSGYMPIGCKSNETQTQNGNNSTAHIAGGNYPLVGYAEEVPAFEKPEILMLHVSSLVEFNVINNCGDGVVVETIELTAGEDIVGTYYINFVDEVFTPSGENYVSKTAKLTVNNGEAIDEGGSAKFYMGIKPFTAKNTDDLTIKITTNKGTYSLSKKVATTFHSGLIKTINVNMDEFVAASESPYASDAAFVCATDDSNNAVYSLGKTNIGGQEATGFKLGKSRESGYFKSGAIGVEGDKYLNFYAVAWKGKSATLYMRVDGGQTTSFTLNAHNGATGNPPFTALTAEEADHYSVKLEGLTASSTIEFSTDASFATESNTTSSRAIIFGMKLTNEPIGTEIPGGTTPEPEPEPEPEVKVVTVAEFLAAAEDSTVYELTGVISNVTNTTYGNFYLTDETGTVLIYGLCSPTGEQQYWVASGAKLGDTITVRTVRSSYNGTAQGKNAIFVSLDPAEGGDEPEPEDPTPGEAKTIAEILASGTGASLSGTIEGIVISNLDLNNLTSKKGMYIQDATGALQFYLAANHSFAFGTKVRINLAGTTLGAYNGAVQISGLALDKIETISTGNTVEPKVVSIADFLANKYEGQYVAIEGVQVADSDLAKTWVSGGAHTSINMEDASGNKFVVFSSKYATYGEQTVAQGSGTIKGISSINNGTMQIIFAQDSDFAGLTGERFGATTPEPEPEPTPEPEVPTDGQYTLLTNLADLKVGDKIVIAAKDYNYAMSTNQADNNRGQAAITKSGDTITFGTDVQILTVEAGNVSGTFAFNTGKGYLYAASSSKNYLKTEATLSNNSSWKVTFENDGTLGVKAQGTNARNVMQYNQQSSLFACYSSASQQAIAIYRLAE